VDFSQYLTDSGRTGDSWWTYVLPNGHSATISTDPKRPFRFIIESTAPEDIRDYPISSVSGVGRIDNQGSGSVESKLAYLAGLPRNEDVA
jgi:hypothetical protein